MKKPIGNPGADAVTEIGAPNTAVFPLAGISLDPPLEVIALTNRGGLKKGATYYLKAVRGTDGYVSQIALNPGWYPMDSFVEVLPQAAVFNPPDKPANDQK